MGLLSGDEARRLGLKFLEGIYYRGKISVDSITLATGGAFPEYHMQGKIKMASRNPLGRLISDESAHTFKVRIDAAEGSVISYEVV